MIRLPLSVDALNLTELGCYAFSIWSARPENHKKSMKAFLLDMACPDDFIVKKDAVMTRCLLSFRGANAYKLQSATGGISYASDGYVVASAAPSAPCILRMNAGVVSSGSFVMSQAPRFVLTVDVDAPEHLATLLVYVALDAGFTVFGYFKVSARNFIRGTNRIYLSWNDFVLPAGKLRADFEAVPIVTWQVRVDCNAAGSVNVKFLSLNAVSASKGSVLVGFDDGWLTQYTAAYTAMRMYGFRGTIAVTPSRVGEVNYCTLAQLKEMHGAGWAMINHTYNHVNLSTLLAVDQFNELTFCRDWLNNNGLGDCASLVAYPNGGYDDATLAVMRAGGFTMGRTVREGVQSPLADKYQIKIVNLIPSVTIDRAKAVVDDCNANGGVVWFLCHRIEATEPSTMYWSVDKFNQLIDYLFTSGANVVTAADLIV